MNPKQILVIIAILCAGLSYVWSPLLGVSVIILSASTFVP